MYKTARRDKLLYKWPVGGLAVEGQTPVHSLIVTIKWLMERTIPPPASVTHGFPIRHSSYRWRVTDALALIFLWAVTELHLEEEEERDKALSNDRTEVLWQPRVRYLSACSGSGGNHLLKAAAATHLQSFSFKENFQDSRLLLTSFSHSAASYELDCFLPKINQTVQIKIAKHVNRPANLKRMKSIFKCTSLVWDEGNATLDVLITTARSVWRRRRTADSQRREVN